MRLVRRVDNERLLSRRRQLVTNWKGFDPKYQIGESIEVYVNFTNYFLFPKTGGLSQLPVRVSVVNSNRL